jgi:2-oxoacid:acceptor oxidoreductase delta subunit (pyruvate/2-ketoisovalerate family)
MSNRTPTWRDIPPSNYGTTKRTVQLQTGNWRTFKPVVDSDACIRCGTCVTFCPDGVITLGDMGAEIDYYFCKGCGVCANECPVKAIEMVKEEK